MMKAKVFILMGVSATGKTTLGHALAEATGGSFYDGDDYHPEANREKMSSGKALTDEDRGPWLEILAELVRERRAESSPSFIACSALKKSYRDILRKGAEDLEFLFLHIDTELLRERIKVRFEAGEHFMPPSLLDSQLETLERPNRALLCDVSLPVNELVAHITSHYSQLTNG